MNFDVIATVPFERKLKRLAKKYPSIRDDLFAIACTCIKKHGLFDGYLR